MIEQDCRSCKDWRTCTLPPEWFDYSQIRWCIYQIFWILQNADTLKAGRWPKQDGVSDTYNGNKQFKTEAHFVKPEIVIAELESRLFRTGLAGRLLEAQIKAGETLETLDNDAWSALLYVKGWRRKRLKFSEWRKKRKYRQKGHLKVDNGTGNRL